VVSRCIKIMHCSFVAQRVFATGIPMRLRQAKETVRTADHDRAVCGLFSQLYFILTLSSLISISTEAKL
jgi:hypothetical protein